MAGAHEHQGGFAVPPDVPAYVEVPATYASGTTLNVRGDGSSARGAAMPMLAYQLDDIPSVATGWTEAHGQTYPLASTNGEAKARFLSNFSHFAADDPIRNWGHPGDAHWHHFFGSTVTNAFSTFASLRNRANDLAAMGRSASTIAGGPYNATGYWVPAMVVSATGELVPYDSAVVYYTANPWTWAELTQRLPRGFRYVFGFNMDDPFNDDEQAEIAAANAQPGTAGRYSYRGNGFEGWTAYEADMQTSIQTTGAQAYSPHFKGTDNSDPWGGNIPAGGWLKATLNAPMACDGTNLWSPGGYKHLRQLVDDAESTLPNAHTGPNGWYLLPQLALTIWIKVPNGNDYLGWELSSDQHASMVAGETLALGRSFHADWLGAWDDAIFGTATGWQGVGLGADGQTGHTLDNSAFNLTDRLITGTTPDGSRNPQVQIPFNWPSLFPEPAASPTGPFTFGAQAPA